MECHQSSMETAYQERQSISDCHQISFHYTIQTLKQILWIMGNKILPFGQFFDGIQRNLNPERASSRSEFSRNSIYHQENGTKTHYCWWLTQSEQLYASHDHDVRAADIAKFGIEDVKSPLRKFNGLKLYYFGYFCLVICSGGVHNFPPSIYSCFTAIHAIL